MQTVEIIGRHEEKTLLDEVLDSSAAELMAVYGRRRVGKTYLLRNYLKPFLVFEYSGIHSISTGLQLENFTTALSKQVNAGLALAQPIDWFSAFDLLATLLKKRLRKKAVIFLDEFPWMQTPKSNFLAAFENFWNTWAVNQPKLVVVVCGSAAGWMIQNVLRNRGGLHNRVTRKLVLQPFTLAETEAFLRSRNVLLNLYQIIQLYMAMGGIPHYLNEAKPGLSAAQIIDKACFAKTGFLYNEFADLYRSLFNEAGRHLKVVRMLAAKPMGLTRNQLIKAASLQSGGSTTLLLEELSSAGFITPYIPYGKKVKDTIYKLTDSFSLFYLKFMEQHRSGAKGTWQRLSDTPSWKSWSGFAFENTCLKHEPAIKIALGIQGIHTEAGIWRGKSDAGGAQIDLIIDRRDNCINLCEIKFYEAPFTIDKKYAAALRNKVLAFKSETGTRKQLFLTFITCMGLAHNEHSLGLVDVQLSAGSLFIPFRAGE